MTIDAIWSAAIAFNLIALIPGKSPLSWRIWATWYLIGNAALRYLDYAHIGHANPVWSVVQIGSTVLLANLVRYTVNPTETFVAYSFAVSATLGCILGLTHKWPNSPVEGVMFATGISLLACGLMSVAKPSVLTVYLLCSALLCLGGAEHADIPALGIATCLLDCLAFGAWAIKYKFTL